MCGLCCKLVRYNLKVLIVSMFVQTADRYAYCSLTVTRRETLWSTSLLLFLIIQRDCLAKVVIIQEKKVVLQFVYTLDPFAVTPLATLLHFLICALTFSV